MLVVNSREIQRVVELQLRTQIGVVDTTGWLPYIDHGYWIAGRDVLREGQWIWSDRSPIPVLPNMQGFQNWYRVPPFNEPFPNNDTKDCLYLQGVVTNLQRTPNLFGTWLTSNCFVEKFFICQRFIGKYTGIRSCIKIDFNKIYSQNAD